MRYYLNLNASLLGAMATIAIVQPALALEPGRIGQIAQAVTVRIETSGPGGSGVIIKHNGNTYTVLTARHVTDSIKGNEEAYVIPEASDGQNYHRIDNNSIQVLPNDVDLAIFQFQSDQNYEKATLGNSDTISPGSKSYVSGYPLLEIADGKPSYQFLDGIITGTAPLGDDGYGITYTNPTQKGMSGGPVFNSDGKVIGIHGQGDRNEAGKTGINAAIPINTYIAWNEQNQNVAVNPSRQRPPETDTSNFYALGVEQFKQKKYPQAIAFFDQAITRNPNDAIAYHDRGFAYANTGEYRLAIADFDESIKLQPNASTYNNRGNAHVALENYSKSIEDFDRAIQIDPNFAFTHYNRGNAYNKLKDYRQAIAAFDQAIRLQSDFADAYVNRGVSYFMLGDCPSAIQNFDRALEIRPNYQQVKNNRDNILSRLNTSDCRSR